MDSFLIDCLHLYRKNGQIIGKNTIKNVYGSQKNNIDIMIKIGIHIFFINCSMENDQKILFNFNEEINNIITLKFNNPNFKFYKVFLSFRKINYIIYNDIINIHGNKEDFNKEDLLMNLYHFIAYTTNIHPGLTYGMTNDVMMEYFP
jgi:hypothetical protein